MDALISSYELTSETGVKIANLKNMPKAWNSPMFLPKLFSNPGPLFLYDKLYLDQRSYESVYDFMSEQLRPKFKELIESPAIEIFELINVESILSTNNDDADLVQNGFKKLYYDYDFESSVQELQQHWGYYAAPTALQFESMNIPLMELFAKKWSQKLKKPLSIIDKPERGLLYRIHKEKNLTEFLSPEISRIIIDAVPKFFALHPHEENWTIDSIRKLRENKYLNSYRKKVCKISIKATKELEKQLNRTKMSISDIGTVKDKIELLKEILHSLHDEIFDNLAEDYSKLQERVNVNKWSVLGGVISSAGAGLSLVNPILGASLGLAGGIIVVGEQTKNYIYKRKYDWTEFCESISTEIKRS